MASEIYCTLMLNMLEVRTEDNTNYKAKALTADLTACRLFAAC